MPMVVYKAIYGVERGPLIAGSGKRAGCVKAQPRNIFPAGKKMRCKP